MYKLAKKLRPIIGNLKIGKYIENKLIQKSNTMSPPPIFIVGLPRSGSTLLYQLIFNYYNVSFFSNFTSFFFSYPASILLLTKHFHLKSRVKTYESNFGLTKGFFSPSEAGGLYRCWFSETSNISNEHIKKTCNKISDIFERPFVWKNLNLSLEIERLYKIFPNALFIKINRRLEYICQSIYLKSLNSDGIDIKGFEKSNLQKKNNLLIAVIEEAKLFDKKINTLLKQSDMNSITVDYELLCDDYLNVLKTIKEVYSNTGYNLVQKKNFLNISFQSDDKVKLNERRWEMMLEQIYKK